MNVVIDSEEHVLPMDGLPLEMTILSVPKIVRKGTYAMCRGSGGYIKNVKTSHRT